MGPGESLRYDGWFWAVGGPIVLVIQVICLIHLLRTGRPYWWLWLIFGFPLVGVAAYVFLEVRPSWGKLDWHSLLWKLKSSQQRIGILREDLAESPTVKNRLALADELHSARLLDQECEVLAGGLHGAFKDDATLLMRLAEAHLEAGRPLEAQQILEKTTPENSRDSLAQFALCKARVFGRLGDAGAEKQFQELMIRRKSEAPRLYYAEFLLRSGRQGEAVPILKDIVYQYRRGTPVWRYLERKWFREAKRLLRHPPG